MAINLKCQFIMSSGCHFPLLYAMDRELELLALGSEADVEIQV